MHKVILSLAIILLGGMTLAGCGSSKSNAPATDSLGTDSLTALADTSSVAALANLTGDAKADLQTLVDELKANSSKYTATQWAYVQQKYAEIVAAAKKAGVSDADLASLTSTVTSYMSSDAAKAGIANLKNAASSTEAVQKATEAKDAIQEKVEEAKKSAEETKESVTKKADEVKSAAKSAGSALGL